MRRHTNGLSLVEVLVVIGVIGVLMAVLLPVLSLVRDSSRATTCLSQQRELAGAMAARSISHDGHMQLVGHIELPRRLTVQDSLPTVLGDAGQTRYSYMPPAGSLTGGRFRRPLIAPDRDLALFLDSPASSGTSSGTVWQCPAQQPTLRLQTQVYVEGNDITVLADYRPIDFAFNEGVFGFSPELDDQRRLRGHLVRIENASRVVLLGDTNNEQFSSAAQTWRPARGESAPDGPIAIAALLDSSSDPRVWPSQPLMFRHRDRVNLVFADGHAAAFTNDSAALETPLLSSR
jgi:prepilin-type processing-associated H-X9-DG protein/prepilin-type N-terminal cleavage/methylation domain-containing protein